MAALRSSDTMWRDVTWKETCGPLQVNTIVIFNHYFFQHLIQLLVLIPSRVSGRGHKIGPVRLNHVTYRLRIWWRG